MVSREVDSEEDTRVFNSMFKEHTWKADDNEEETLWISWENSVWKADSEDSWERNVLEANGNDQRCQYSEHDNSRHSRSGSHGDQIPKNQSYRDTYVIQQPIGARIKPGQKARSRTPQRAPKPPLLPPPIEKMWLNEGLVLIRVKGKGGEEIDLDVPFFNCTPVDTWCPFGCELQLAC